MGPRHRLSRNGPGGRARPTIVAGGAAHRQSNVPATSGPPGRGTGAPRGARAGVRSAVWAGPAHFRILVTRPAPTVRPPSRIANRNPSSIAIGAINSTDISVLSPGMHISVPSGNAIDPVTSVVRK